MTNDPKCTETGGHKAVEVSQPERTAQPGVGFRTSKKDLTFNEAFVRAQKAALNWLPVGSYNTTMLREMRNSYAYGYAAALLAEGAHETPAPQHLKCLHCGGEMRVPKYCGESCAEAAWRRRGVQKTSSAQSLSNTEELRRPEKLP